MGNWIHTKKEWEWVLDKAQEGQGIFASAGEETGFVKSKLSEKGLKERAIVPEHGEIVKILI